MSESRLFKDYYDEKFAGSLASEVREVCPEFRAEEFAATVIADINKLEFKDRIRLLARALHDNLPQPFPRAWAILERILGSKLDAEDGSLNDGFALWPVAQFIEDYGLDHFNESIAAMYEITQRHTAEFAIRPFLQRYPQRTLRVLETWTHDPSPHVRRLVSEGTRPRLPWAARLDQFISDPSPTLALLEKLKDDPSEYVRRSVANHLNDIGKDHPDLLLETARRWWTDAPPGRQWIVRRALRSLLKEGDPKALEILGYAPAAVELEALEIRPRRLTYGNSLQFSFSLRSTSDKDQDLMIDYAIHFVKKNGGTSPKIFKLTTRSLPAGESVQITRNHAIKPVTTRTYYPGSHRLEVQVNGAVLGGAEFELLM